jgi:hypothetical protein
MQEQRCTGGHAVWQLQLPFIGHLRVRLSVDVAAYAGSFSCVWKM